MHTHSDTQKLLRSLHRLERIVLPLLSSQYKSLAQLTKQSGLSEVEVRRALQWLEGKTLAVRKEKEVTIIQLGKNGQQYAQQHLPEHTLLVLIKKLKQTTVQTLMREHTTILNPQEISIGIGTLKKRAYIEMHQNNIKLTNSGEKALKTVWVEEVLLQNIAAAKQKVLKTFSESEKAILKTLQQRKDIVEVLIKKDIEAVLTSQGKQLHMKDVKNLVDALTPSMLRDKSWQKKEFRRFTLDSITPRIVGGRKQPYRKFLDDARKKFVALGFKELTGPLVETEFWNMDALFMPQFHSARDIHDAYHIKKPTHSTSLPKHVLQKVKEAHEKGVAGSKGWRYAFDVKRTHRHVLRTQDTAISPRALVSPELQVPGKYFQIARCFRYDVIDATHLADFNQIGGFVIEEKVNLRHLFGLLKLFAEEFCQTEQIKITPAYFPFTEPSASLYAKHPELGWIELAGSGIFRPEMCTPLGVKQPVIAWGIGLERLAMIKLGITDIRQLFSQDLAFLRNAGVVL